MLASLLEYVAGVFLVLEIAHSFAAYYAFGHLAGYELIETSQVERTACLIYKGADVIFFGFAAFVVVMMMVMVVLVVFMFVLVMMLFMLMMVFVMFVFVVIIVVVVNIFHFADPCRSGYGLVEVEKTSFQYHVKVDVAIVAFYYLSLRLQCAYNLFQTVSLAFADFGGLVQQYYIAELNLLYDKVFEVIFANVLFG